MVGIRAVASTFKHSRPALTSPLDRRGLTTLRSNHSGRCVRTLSDQKPCRRHVITSRLTDSSGFFERFKGPDYSISVRTLSSKQSNKVLSEDVESSRDPVIQLFTSPTCTLCDEVLFQLEQIRLSYRFKVELVDIKTDRLLNKKYKYDIPVVHLNNQYLCKHSLNVERLITRLQELQPIPPS